MTERMTTDQFRRVTGTEAMKKQGTSGPVTLNLPLPPRCLHPNARTHWAPKAKAVKESRAAAAMLAKSQRPKTPWKNARYTLLFELCRNRDEDGLLSWVKAYLDGLQDAGVIVNDSGLSLAGIQRVLVGTKGKPGVTIRVWED